VTPEELTAAYESINQTVMGAIGGGPPLRYLWISFAMVAGIWLVVALFQ
jgi:hypothetical protein